MEDGKAGSIKISGSGTAGGGVYEEIAISGSGKVTGDAQAEQVRISGSAKFDGGLKAGTLSGSGSFHIVGDLETSECKCSGSGRIGGNVKAERLKASGSIKIGGNVKAAEAHISGSARIAGDVEGERFRSSGALNVGGLLSADLVEIAPGGSNSRVREIGGEKITVKAGSGGNGTVFGLQWCCGRGSLEADSIEGDDVSLEITTAKVVRGQRVTIGPGCKIKRVEYGESLRIDPKAEVDETIFTGKDSPPEVDRTPVPSAQSGVGDRTCGWGVHLGEREIRNPVLRGLAVILSLVIAAAAVVFALSVAGLAVGLTLGGVLLLLVILTAGVPLLILGAAVLQILMIPAHAIARVFGGESWTK